MMKGFIVFVLVFGMVLGLCGCSPSESASAEIGQGAESQEFRVGFGKMEITPEESVPLQGFSNVTQRMSTSYLDRLYVRCTAISDEDDNTLLLFAADLTTWPENAATSCRDYISEKTGIPVEYILLSASHTHSGPAIRYTSVASVMRYMDFLRQNMLTAAQDALASRAPAQMSVGSVEIQGLSFLRHYELADGTKVGYESMIPAEGAVAHVGTGDYTMQLLKFTREGEKDIILMNWQGHPTRASSKTYDISADVVGQLCLQMEANMDCHAAYFQGASGNMNLKTEILSEEFPRDYREHGAAIIRQVMDAQVEFTPVNSGKVRVLNRLCEGKVNHEEDSKTEDAQIVQAYWKETNNRKESDGVARQYGFRSVYHAGSVITRSELPETDVLELNAVSIGDVAFVSNPYEMFAVNGLQIKEKSPFTMTFIAGYASGHVGYIPSADAFSYEGYERDSTRYVQGTAEQLVAVFLDMLNELYNTQ